MEACIMEPATTVLGGIVVALVGGVIGKAIGTNGNVKGPVCKERQLACQNLITEKIDNLGEKIETLTKAVNGKLSGV